ncbi:hypothetical protein GLOTRDRAFT_126163 [Gloeophyllum trabeum ATCC 11539]|uniref:Uncharacterized protein n=1 Tax=Gloeophyllum trabeum (strain ATCC 11539 / FP-39264 / Madison 617) TaxID=670483 RepID=S7QKG0_GLOTA|nr:uncharacterized protein GLOTRDRAFT_126163 [Gloeophyllum trabeum ATCC 11539]EPQ59872.1 hypothetical protein GLOTRDRAFT_126163 [Gloeophyllum trabeum ATCC 11539]
MPYAQPRGAPQPSSGLVERVYPFRGSACRVELHIIANASLAYPRSPSRPPALQQGDVGMDKAPARRDIGPSILGLSHNITTNGRTTSGWSYLLDNGAFAQAAPCTKGLNSRLRTL